MAAGEFRNYIVASSGAGWHAQCNVQRDLTEQEIDEQSVRLRQIPAERGGAVGDLGVQWPIRYGDRDLDRPVAVPVVPSLPRILPALEGAALVAGTSNSGGKSSFVLAAVSQPLVLVTLLRHLAVNLFADLVACVRKIFGRASEHLVQA